MGSDVSGVLGQDEQEKLVACLLFTHHRRWPESLARDLQTALGLSAECCSQLRPNHPQRVRFENAVRQWAERNPDYARQWMNTKSTFAH